MITKELIERINYLSRKERYEGLTPEEKDEQARVRRIYIDSIKDQVREALKNIEFEPEESDRIENQKNCDCGHSHNS